MFTINLNDKEYQVKNSLKELTVGEYEKITDIISDNTVDRIDKYLLIFDVLGVPVDGLESLAPATFFGYVKEFNKVESTNEFIKNEKIKDFVIKNRVYQSYTGDSFELNVKQMRYIEKYIKKNPKAYISDLLAIIFKDIELTDNEHYTDAHIRYKSSLIKDNITADLALPYLAQFSIDLIVNLESEI
jgi:hypothetical protein